MTGAVLFDLGNTLAAYYHASDFQPILAQAIGEVRGELVSRGLCELSMEAALSAAVGENREAPDHRVTPMIGRLERVFRLRVAKDPTLAAALCQRFLAPIFAVGRVYDDTLASLRQLREVGFRTAIVSNTPWGSPSELWRVELQRLGLADIVDAVVLCGDVGWRKPAPEIYRYAADKLGCRSSECVFVGDDLRWDIEGSACAGMRPLLIDRDARHPEYAGARIVDLHGLLAALEASA